MFFFLFKETFYSKWLLTMTKLTTLSSTLSSRAIFLSSSKSTSISLPDNVSDLYTLLKNIAPNVACFRVRIRNIKIDGVNSYWLRRKRKAANYVQLVLNFRMSIWGLRERRMFKLSAPWRDDGNRTIELTIRRPPHYHHPSSDSLSWTSNQTYTMDVLNSHRNTKCSFGIGQSSRI